MPALRPTRLGALGGLAVVIAVVTAVVLVASPGGGPPRAAQPVAMPPMGGFASVVSRATPSVVQIRSARGLGSGIVYDGSGHVVTNAHVVAGSTSFQVTDAEGGTHTATLRGVFPAGDLAVIDVSGGSLPAARFADSGTVRTGDYALAIGNPLGLQSSVTFGIISATSRTVSEGAGVALPSVIQTSAPINPGNSGGALIDATGAVIGIPTLAALDPELGGSAAPGIGFAISSNTVRRIVPQLIAHGRVTASGRSFLGVDLRTLSGGGTLVASVAAGGPAAKAGIRAGDVLVQIAGAPVASADDVAVALAGHRPGSRIAVEIKGPQGTRTVQVTLGQTPAAR